MTLPAADIADNPYWKRDVRRSYPKLSVVSQPDVVALLTVGSAAAPKDDVLQLGEAGSKQLVQVKKESEQGLSPYFQQNAASLQAVLGPDGLPPRPPSLHHANRTYELIKDEEQTYGSRYVDRGTGLGFSCALLISGLAILAEPLNDYRCLHKLMELWLSTLYKGDKPNLLTFICYMCWQQSAGHLKNLWTRADRDWSLLITDVV